MAKDEIVENRFPDNVRLRKEMYLDSPNHCIMEIIDNAVDEFNAGHAKKITFAVSVTGSKFPKITVTDDGRGIPTKLSNSPGHEGETQAELALGNLSTSGKFGGGSYKTATAGLHGVGASCVNAVSNSFNAVIRHEHTVTRLGYEKGLLKERVIEEPCSSAAHGTEISFVLDETLWTYEEFDFAALKKRLKQLAYINPGLTIVCTIDDKEESFFFPEGIGRYYSDITASKVMLNSEAITIDKTIDDPEAGPIEIGIRLGFSSGYTTDIYAFVNNVATTGGDHFIGLTQGIVRAATLFLENNSKYKNLLKNLASEDFREGLFALMSVRVMAPKFEGQGKKSIKMPPVRSAVYNAVVDELKLYLEQHPNFVKVLAEKLERASKSRLAAKRARDAIRSAKSTVDSSLPGKLAACSSKKPEECAIYIVEGDSAAGSAVQGRDPKYQAILPVFGKILNASKAREDEILKSEKMLDVIKALKCGIGKTFDIKKLRYHRIVIMADADVDGYHICCLWMTFFYKYLPELIRAGHIYIQLSPLYRVTEIVGKKEVNHYFFDDEELAGFSSKHKYHVSYIKGLGELQPKQLWESTMSPENRRLIQVSEEDAEEAMRAIDVCMGDDVGVRREFIMTNADFSKVVD